MPSSVMHSLVKSVINEESGGGGGEADVVETSDTDLFVSEILSLVNATFSAINHEVKSVAGKSSGWRERAVERGLCFIADKNNEDTIIDSVVDSDTAGRALTKLYFSAMHALAREEVTDKKELMRVNFDPFGVFIAKLYRELASDAVMKHDYFNTMSGSARHTFMTTALRKVMESSIMWPSKMKKKAAAGDTTTTTSSTTSAFSRPITPHDSVSNISKLAPPSAPSRLSVAPPAAASVVGSAVGEAVGRSAASQVMGGLSEKSLSRHNQRRSSQFSAFKSASVVKPPAAPSTRVVYVTDSKDRSSRTRHHSVRDSVVSGGGGGSHISSSVSHVE